MKFSVLSSGSRANCTWIGTHAAHFLIDCGLSARQLKLRLISLGLDHSLIKAILLTHEHKDHVFGVASVARALGIPVYLSQQTLSAIEEIKLDYSGVKIQIIQAEREFKICDTTFIPFKISHDAVDPFGFEIIHNTYKLVHATDMGRITEAVSNRMLNADALVLEANHDLDSLWACAYHWELKKRIASEFGHLSNSDAGHFLAQHCNSKLQYIILAHLSENSNTPEKALETIHAILQDAGHDLAIWKKRISCASRHIPTPIFELLNSTVVVTDTSQIPLELNFT